ncbi:polyketide cyclase/dehydrase/lipid transport protein [Pseudonocardia sediminis]|uniref:Polyketide cyclase/dehydrase/lipid transport protein n=1 Tax=Pseudonocardia sediminis TaxID=1397368 RepID=A0A4V2FQB2_PSEST|nr:SRPBCC family protein [Pseudonocardia sediminis]RZT84070.1 polyketide cyclase/dehydrase/lipid transport protein [Pseudonocardia sediminis]
MSNAASREELTVPVDVGVPADYLWRAVTDWPGQSDWMLGTTVELTGGDGRSVGSTLRAVTGIGPLGVADTMEITEWADEPGGPRRAVVTHTGSVVQGDGVFAVVELGPRRSRFLWTELLDVPFGALGRAGWPLVRPAFRAGVASSLRKMARQTEERYRAEEARRAGNGG